jgi:hypothetical protein
MYIKIVYSIILLHIFVAQISHTSQVPAQPTSLIPITPTTAPNFILENRTNGFINVQFNVLGEKRTPIAPNSARAMHVSTQGVTSLNISYCPIPKHCKRAALQVTLSNIEPDTTLYLTFIKENGRGKIVPQTRVTGVNVEQYDVDYNIQSRNIRPRINRLDKNK